MWNVGAESELKSRIKEKMMRCMLPIYLGLILVLAVHGFQWRWASRQSVYRYGKFFMTTDSTIVSPFDSSNEVSPACMHDLFSALYL